MQWINIVNICLVSVWNWIQKNILFLLIFYFPIVFIYVIHDIQKVIFSFKCINVLQCWPMSIFTTYVTIFWDWNIQKQIILRYNLGNFVFLKSGRKYHFTRISPKQIFSFKHKMNTKSPLSNAMVSICLFMKFYFFRLNLSRELTWIKLLKSQMIRGNIHLQVHTLE